MKTMKKEFVPKEILVVITVVPLKDHVVKQNEFYYELKKGVMVDIDKRFLEVLLTEKVISNKG
jgi:hypothetical protein